MHIIATFSTGPTGGAPAHPYHVLKSIAECDTLEGSVFVLAQMYAAGTHRIVSNNTLMGSVVSDYFCRLEACSTTNTEKKANSDAAEEECNAGQKCEVVYANTGNNRPNIGRCLDVAGFPVFQVMSTEVR